MLLAQTCLVIYWILKGYSTSSKDLLLINTTQDDTKQGNAKIIEC